MHYRDYVPSERTTPYTYGFVYDQPAIADPGLIPMCHDLTLGLKSNQLQNTHHLFFVLNQQGLLTTGPANDTYNRMFISRRQINPTSYRLIGSADYPEGD